ncbi:hypothetical protein AVEN_91638-1 [Araneus ventricosus]|uniref:Uncharacterized protein n=1 Tax=Araneus ventricosus TaxID=182803 RepID=A0A4Y2EVI2_ARAVE|nr:hypothetical protein AVEN_91638-1 [Araneus ventricosus]
MDQADVEKQRSVNQTFLQESRELRCCNKSILLSEENTPKTNGIARLMCRMAKSEKSSSWNLTMWRTKTCVNLLLKPLVIVRMLISYGEF